MADLLPFIVIGLTVGSVYGLAATGLVLTYKTSGIFNFAYGALASVSVFIFYELVDVHGWPWPVAGVLCVFVLGPVMGILLELLTRQLAHGGSDAADRRHGGTDPLGRLAHDRPVQFGKRQLPFLPFDEHGQDRVRQRRVGTDHHRDRCAGDDRAACTPSSDSLVAALSCGPSWTTPSSCPCREATRPGSVGWRG